MENFKDAPWRWRHGDTGSLACRSTTTTAIVPTEPTVPTLKPGADCRHAFQAAYENRYTWDQGFPGYGGRCQVTSAGNTATGTFRVGVDLKAHVEGLSDPALAKAVHQQLWEVAIHRVRRPFAQVHGDNGFVAGDTNAVGMEVVVTGKAAGDRYRIRDNVVTMVHRHIHGQVVTIYTEAVTGTGAGYLSRHYRSRYSDPRSGEPLGPEQHFSDSFAPLTTGHWTLRERLIRCDAEEQVFRFLDLEPLGASQ